MRLAKAAQSWDQPLRREARLDADADLDLAGACQSLRRRGDAVEGVGHGLEIAAAFLGQLHAARCLAKQRHAEPGLERPHMAADRGVTDAKLARSAGKAAMTGGNLEGAQRIERRQVARHRIRDFPLQALSAIGVCSWKQPLPVCSRRRATPATSLLEEVMSNDVFR